MFQQACSQIRDAVYGIMGCSQLNGRVNCTSGTASHLTHVENNLKEPTHTSFEVIRAPDIGQDMATAQLIAEDPVRDIALLRIDTPRSDACVTLERNKVPIGTPCGSVGFPLCWVEFQNKRKMFHLTLRFQAAYISCFNSRPHASGREISYYETDMLMYRGSSGCPGFLTDATVFGMHNQSVIEKPRKQPAGPSNKEPQPETRLAISIWVPSTDIIDFAQDNGVAL